MPKVRFIAEASSNHGRDLARAKEFVQTAADIGCQGVKFQLFKIEELFAPEILTKSQQHRDRKQWELPLEFIPTLSAQAHQLGLEFACTPFYLEAVNELRPYIDFYKVASYEILWNDLFGAIARTGLPIVFSTGMADLPEIKSAIKHLERGRSTDLTVLHCTSAYPTPPAEANLKAIETLGEQLLGFANRFNLKIGYSDHTVSEDVILRAVNHFGATLVEFHLDLDGQGAEYASGHCWLPEQIQSVILKAREGVDGGNEDADGTGKVGPSQGELADRVWRADPDDGLRPLKHLRQSFNG